MKNLPKLGGISFLLAFMALTPASHAQAPSGNFQYNFTTNDGPGLSNFSGIYATPYYVTNDSLQLSHDARGGIDAYYPSPFGLSSGYVLGTLRGASSNLKMRLLSSMWFPMDSSTYPNGFGLRRRDRLTLTFDPSARTLSGTDRVEEAFRMLVFDHYPYNHLKTVSRNSFSQPVTLAVPEATDGSWTLDLNIVPTGNKLSGTGSIHFANGKSFAFELVGSYSPRSQKSKVLLKGTGASKGASLVLSLVGPQTGVERMSGRVGGQSVRLQ
jgi:hypothetical protein